MLNFPNAPTIGQVFNGNYQWDGVAWTFARTTVSPGDPASNTNPLMNGVMLPGLTTTYARGDHVHPTDTSRALVNNATLTGTSSAPTLSTTGDVTVTGVITAGNPIKGGHIFGTPSGTPGGAVAKADANILLYSVDASNWAGIGSDAGGGWIVRVGLSGSPVPALRIDQNRDAFFSATPIIPTRPAGESSGWMANTAFVQQNPASGAFLPLAGGNVTGLFYVNGDMRSQRSDGTGVVYLNNTGTRYIYWNNTDYTLPGAHAVSSSGRLWGDGDFKWPITSLRHVYVGDRVWGRTEGLVEPWGASCFTGCSGYSANGGFNSATMRGRQIQIYSGGGWWVAAHV